MAKIHCDVEIKTVQVDNKKLKIMGRYGGELIFSLNGQSTATASSTRTKSCVHRKTARQLLVDCYRTRGIRAVDVSRYHGKMNGKIIIQLDTLEKRLTKRMYLYIMSPELRLIEHGTARVCVINNPLKISKGTSLYYRTKTTHRYSKVKIICCEIFFLKHINLSTF